MTTHYEWEQETDTTNNEFDIAEEMVASSGAVAVVFGNEVQNLTKAAPVEGNFSKKFQDVYERPALAVTATKAAKPTV